VERRADPRLTAPLGDHQRHHQVGDVRAGARGVEVPGGAGGRPGAITRCSRASSARTTCTTSRWRSCRRWGSARSWSRWTRRGSINCWKGPRSATWRPARCWPPRARRRRRSSCCWIGGNNFELRSPGKGEGAGEVSLVPAPACSGIGYLIKGLPLEAAIHVQREGKVVVLSDDAFWTAVSSSTPISSGRSSVATTSTTTREGPRSIRLSRACSDGADARARSADARAHRSARREHRGAPLRQRTGSPRGAEAAPR